MMVRQVAAASLLAISLAAGLAHAQAQEPAAPQRDPYRDQRALPDPSDPKAAEALLRARGEAYHRAPDAAQNPEELRTTQALNAEIAAQNGLADKADAAARLEHDAAVARYDIEVQQTRERARAEAEAARTAQEQYDRDYAAWREQVRLCQSGFREACAAQPAWRRP